MASSAIRRSYATLPSSKLLPEHVLHARFAKNNTILTLSRRVYQPSSELDLTNIPADVEPKDIYNQRQMIDMIRPRQEALITVSTGQLGFRGTSKSTYDAAFQTSARMFGLMVDKGLTTKNLEIVTRNFGESREAFFKALFGKEGTRIRPLIKRLTDGTRLKFGGDRAPNKQRK